MSHVIEMRRNVFDFVDRTALAHCIAADLGMGAGIAVEFQKRFGLRDRIRRLSAPINIGDCIYIARPDSPLVGVFNLITKARSTGKPSYDTIEAAIYRMREIAVSDGIHKIAMPRIGCGLDHLSWPQVRELLNEAFGQIDVEIVVCRL